MIDSVLGITFLKLADSVAKVRLQKIWVDDHGQLVPLTRDFVSLLLLILSRQVNHGPSVLGVEPNSLAIRVDGTVHFLERCVIKSFQKPKIGILEVKLGVPELIIWHSNFRNLINLVNTVINVQENERILDILQIVELYLLKYVEMSFLIISWELFFNQAHFRGSFLRSRVPGAFKFFTLIIIRIFPLLPFFSHYLPDTGFFA